MWGKCSDKSRAVFFLFVKIDIIDDGIGIEKEEIPKIFGRFYRSLSVADQPGVGIGLSAREIIQAQKGVYKSDIKERKGFYIFCVSSDSKEGIVSKL